MDAGDPPAVCDCAAKALKDEIGAEDYATYEKVGAIYLDEITSGRGRADAWTAAIGQVGVSLSATNPMGKAQKRDEGLRVLTLTHFPEWGVPDWTPARRTLTSVSTLRNTRFREWLPN